MSLPHRVVKIKSSSSYESLRTEPACRTPLYTLSPPGERFEKMCTSSISVSSFLKDMYQYGDVQIQPEGLKKILFNNTGQWQALMIPGSMYIFRILVFLLPLKSKHLCFLCRTIQTLTSTSDYPRLHSRFTCGPHTHDTLPGNVCLLWYYFIDLTSASPSTCLRDPQA